MNIYPASSSHDVNNINEHKTKTKLTFFIRRYNYFALIGLISKKSAKIELSISQMQLVKIRVISGKKPPIRKKIRPLHPKDR